MAMRKDSRRELNKLRELVHFLLVGQKCFFCNKPLSTTAETFVEHGNATGPALDERISVHHVDGDHSNNQHDNKALCHLKCHKSHHRRENNLKRGELRKQEKAAS